MEIRSLNVALPTSIDYAGRVIMTGGYKSPIDAAHCGMEQIDGDGQADRVNHGGVDKAVNVYAHDHYPYWERVFGHALTPGAFSENLTIAGALESSVCIGDHWRAGEVIFEVSQPRMPCSKLALKHDKRHLVQWVQETGYTGFYLRVIAPGMLARGARIEVIARDPRGVSIADVNAIYYGRGAPDTDAIARALAVPALSRAAREVIANRLARAERDSS
jgi:MOSC domain-containing protein YiiM